MEKRDYFSNTSVFMEEKGKNAITKDVITRLLKSL
jgi:hypothetical protein